MAQAGLCDGCADGAEGAAIHHAQPRAGGHRRGVPPAHPLAARRLPLRLAGHHPDADPLLAASPVSAPYHRAATEIEGEKTAKKRFKPTAIGFFHIDIAEVRTEDSKLHLFVAIDRTAKFAFAQLHDRASRRIAADFLRALIAAVPYTIHTVLTDNGTQFTELAAFRRGAVSEQTEDKPDAPGRIYRIHAFDYACQQNNIEHRLTKPNHPWTNGQVERMNRTLKEATVRAFHYENKEQLQVHLAAFLNAYNFAKRLKTLHGLTPYEAVCNAWTETPHRFRLPPDHLTAGLNI
jgi:transposase InsO family protein